MTNSSTKTIVFIHGAFVNADTWKPSIEFFSQQGYECLALNWPYDDGIPAELRAQGNKHIGKIGILEIINHYKSIISSLPHPPIIIGHSYGGLFTQLLLDQGYGTAGIAVCPAPPKGVHPNLGLICANLTPITAGLLGKKVIQLSQKNFNRFFANNLPAKEQKLAFDLYTVPTPIKIFLQSAFAPFTSLCTIDYHREIRSPLLIIAATEDKQVPAIINKKNYKKYRASETARVDFIEFTHHGHSLIIEPGHQEITQKILEWISSLSNS